MILVFFVHYVSLSEPWVDAKSSTAAIGRAMQTIGSTGVDLFFVLSGYLIYGSLISRQQPFFALMRRRVARLYPAFTAVFVLYLLLSAAYPSQNKIPSPWTEGLLYLVQNFLLLPGIFDIEPMITVAWSLSYESFYYLVIPLVLVAFGLRQWSSGQRCTLFVIAAAAFVAYCELSDGMGMYVRLAMFIAGILLFEVMKHRSATAPSGAQGLLALAFGFAVLLVPLGEIGLGFPFRMGVLFVAFLVFCWSCFARPQEWLGQAFSWTPLRWLGNMSYSYYLLQRRRRLNFLSAGVPGVMRSLPAFSALVLGTHAHNVCPDVGACSLAFLDRRAAIFP